MSLASRQGLLAGGAHRRLHLKFEQMESALGDVVAASWVWKISLEKNPGTPDSGIFLKESNCTDY